MQPHTTKTQMIAYRLKTSHGFTLIEVLVVLFILASLASVSVVAYQGRMAKVRVDQTTIYIKTLTSAIESYELAVGRFPTTEQGLNALLTPPSDLPNPAKWSGPYLKDNAPTEDPWGSPYQYVCPGTRTRDGFDVWSRGPDGNDGTEDDIGNWTK